MLRKMLDAFRGSEEPEAEEWVLATAHDGQRNPIIVRCRATTPEGVRTEEYPHLITIAWEFESENGLPARDEKERMNALEQCLVDTVEPLRQAFMMVVVTGKGACEWRFYSKDNIEFMTLLKQALVGQPEYPLDITHESDPTWGDYRRFLPPPDLETQQVAAVASSESLDEALVDERELLARAQEFGQRGMLAESSDLLMPLTSSDDLGISIDSLIELVNNQSGLKLHEEVLSSLERLEGILNDNFDLDALLSSSDEGAQNFIEDMLFIRHTKAAMAYEGLGRIDEAIEHAQAAVAVVRARRTAGDAGRVAHREYVVAVLLRTAGRFAEALATLDAALAESPTHIPSLILKATLLELAGRKAEGEALFASIQPEAEDEAAYYTLNAPAYHALRGEKDRVLQLLEEAARDWGGPFIVAYALEEKDFEPYKDDPDFRACLDRCRATERDAEN